ncbi:VCBS domain-containing protein [Neptunomonas phycophila]|uniref:VCBS domain-containing protein n=1 Tax=Neptunomonas phycophila TaxID=1572645 RepID=UPI001BE8C9A4|nr:VCBS domain-containing protein [Neptunomonas phycophila]MBT3144904.1 VCBS domain-containing protein [Neptunomonas phycophila]
MKKTDLLSLESRLLLDAAAAVTLTDNTNVDVNSDGSVATASGQEDTAVALAGVAISDENGSDNYSLRLTLNADAISAGSLFLQGGSEAGTQLTLTGAASEINTALAGVQVQPGSNYTGDLSVAMVLKEGATDRDQATYNIALTPVNDDPILSNPALEVQESSTVTFSIEALGLSDPDIESGEQGYDQLIIEIGSLPTNGRLYFSGSPVAPGSTLDASQLASLTYVHDGSDVASGDSDSFDIRVLDGAGGEAAASLSVNLLPLNTAPEITGEPEQFEGETTSLGLSYSDSEAGHADTSSNAQVAITDISGLTDRGVLFLDSDNDGIVDAGEEISSVSDAAAQFSADKLALLSFAHDGDEPNVVAPVFTIQITDNGGGEGDGAKITTSRDVTIAITENNDDPIAVVTGDPINAVDTGNTGVTLTLDDLTATDPDSTNEQLVFSVASEPDFGQIQLNQGTVAVPDWVALPVGGVFSVADIADGKVRYVQTSTDGSSTDTGLSFTLSDSEYRAFDNAGEAGAWRDSEGNLQTGSLTFIIGSTTGDPADYATPAISDTIVNQGRANFDEAATITITSADLSYTLTANTYTFPATQVVYSVSSLPSNGTLYLDGNAIKAYGSFTQDDIDNNRITFEHNGSEDHHGSFSFIVTNGGNYEGTGSFTLNAYPINDAPDVGESTVELTEATDTNDGIVRIGLSDIEMSDEDGSQSTLDAGEDPNSEGGTDVLWFQITALPEDGVLERWNTSSSAWETITLDGAWYEQSILSSSVDGGTSGIRYQHSGGDASANLIDSFTYVVRDDLTAAADPLEPDTSSPDPAANNQSDTGTVTLEISAFNDAPIIAASSTDPDQSITNSDGNTETTANEILVVGEGDEQVITSSHLTAIDSDNSTRQSTFKIINLTENGRILFNGKTLIVGSTFTQDDIDNGFISYEHDGSETRSDQFTFEVSDGPLTTAVGTFDIQVQARNDAAEVTANQPNDSFVTSNVLDLGGAFTLSDVDISDADSGLGVGAGETDELTVTLTLNDGADAQISNADASITLNDVTGLTVTGTPGTDTQITLTGSLADLQAALTGLGVSASNDLDSALVLVLDADDRLQANSSAANGGTVNDDGSAVSQSNNVSSASVNLVTSTVNDAPVVTLAAQTVNEDTPTLLTGLSISDVDSFDEQVTATVAVTAGSLSTSNSGVAVTGNGTTDITLTGTVDQVNAALAQVLYTPDDQDNGTETLTLTVTDSDVHGASSSLSDSESTSLTITAINDAPQLNITDDHFTLNTGTNIDITGVSIADINDEGQSTYNANQEVVLSVSQNAGDADGLISVTGEAAASTLTLTGTLADINAKLATLNFSPTDPDADDTAVINIVYSDLANGDQTTDQSNALTESGAITIDISNTNDAPVVNGDATFAMNEDQSFSLSGYTISDADHFDTSSMTISITVTEGTLADSSSNGTLSGDLRTLTLNAASLAELNALLAATSYSPDADYFGSDTLTITVTDGGNTGDGGTLNDTLAVAVTVNNVNDRPDNTGVDVTLADENEGIEAPAGETFTSLLAGNYSDATDDQTANNGGSSGSQATALSFIAITGNAATAEQGEWQVFVGGSWTSISTSASDSAAVIVTADTLVRFLPADDFNGEPGELTTRLGDNSQPTISTSSGGTDTYNLSTTGDLGADESVWSDATSNVGIHVNAVNDPPTITVSSADLADIAEDSTPSGTSVLALYGPGYDDGTDGQSDTAVNNGSDASSLGGIALIDNNTPASQGEWQYNTGGGWVAVGSAVTTTSALVLAPDAEIRFVPAADFHGVVSGLSYVVADSDQTAQNGQLVDVSYSATGTWSDSASPGVTKITVNPVNDAPVVAGDTGGSTTPIVSIENTGQGTGSAEENLFSNVTLSDIDAVLGSDDFGGGSITVNIADASAADQLLVDSGLTGVQSTSAPTTGQLVIQLASGTTAEQVVTIVEAIRFSNTSDAPNTDVRGYNLVVNDGNNNNTSGGPSSANSNTLSGFLQVQNTNDTPTPQADTNTVNEDTNASGNVLTNDTDPDVESLTVNAVNGNAGLVSENVAGDNGGVFVIESNGDYTFSPGSDFQYLKVGEQIDTQVTYQVTDADGLTATTTLTVTVTGTDDVPVLTPDTGDVVEDDAATLMTSGTLAAGTNGDAGEDKFVAETLTGTYGQLAVDENGAWNYSADNSQTSIQTIAQGDTRTDTFTVTSADNTTTTTVTITLAGVNDTPVANNDSGATSENATLTVPVNVGLLSNDTDVDSGDTLSVVEVDNDTNNLNSPVSGSTGGTFTVAGDGSYSFNPGTDFDYLAAGETATTTLAVLISDSQGATSSSLLSVVVTGTNDAPVATTPAAQTDSDGASVSYDISTYFLDPDTSDTLSYSADVLPAGLSLNTATGVISGDIASNASQGGNTATPGQYQITLTATDNNSATEQAVFTWTVSNVDPTANDDTASVNEGAEPTDSTTVAGNVIITSPTSAENDQDGGADADTLSSDAWVAGEATPLAISGDTDIVGTYGTLSVSLDGSYSYAVNNALATIQALNTSQSLNDVFTYQVSDGQGGTDEATLTITINGTNDAPVTVGSLSNQTANDGEIISDIDISGLFDDVDNGAVLTYSAADLPAGLTLNSATGVISGQVDGDASINGAASNGVYNVVITATDENSTQTQSSFEWVVTNVAPIAQDDVASVNEGEASTDVTAVTGNVITAVQPGDVSDGEQNGDDDTLNVTGIGFGTHVATTTAVDTGLSGNYGVVSVGADGAYTYQVDNTLAAVQALADGESFTEVFTYSITDGQGGNDSALLTITINGTNDAPEITVNAGDTAVSSLTETDAGLTDSGQLSLTDLDTTDTVTASVDSLTTTGELDTLSNADLLSMLTVTSDVIDGTTQNGIIEWDFDSAGTTFDYLAEGEQLVLTYNVLVEDSEGAQDTQTVTLTINGTNDAPEITVNAGDTTASSLTETDAGLTDSGQLSLTDLDTSDTVTASVDSLTTTGELDTLSNADLLSMLTVTSDVIDGTTRNGIIEWDFDSAGTTFDYLAEGEQLVLTYNVLVEDSEGAQDTQTVTLTINGTNDAPEITVNAGDTTASSLTETDAGLTDSGQLSLTDLDTSDTVTASVDSLTTTGELDTLSNADLLSMLTVTSDVIDGTTQNGIIEWDFDSAGTTFDYLAEGEQLVLTYKVLVEDSEGAQATQTVTLTINGTNDAPEITVNAGDKVNSNLTETNSGLVDNGQISVGDLDTSEAVAAEVDSVSTSGDTGPYSPAQLLDMLAVTDVVIGSGSQAGVVEWNFDSQGATFDHLADGETLVLTYTVSVTDAQGATSQQLVTLTIEGSNDAPEITLTPTDSATAELTETDDGLQSEGTLSVTDLDTTDEVIARVSHLETTGDTHTYSPDDLLAMLDVTATVIENGSQNEVLEWNFDSQDIAFDHLAVGEQLVLSYTVTVEDVHGATSEQRVTITINGAKDAPSIIVENGDTAEVELTETNEPLSTEGQLSIFDKDTSDSIVAAVENVAVVGDTHGLSHAELQTMLSVTDLVIDSDTQAGTLGWSFDSAEQTFDYLAAGEKLVLTYTVSVTDSQGNSNTHPIVVTLVGTNDLPEVSTDLDDTAVLTQRLNDSEVVNGIDISGAFNDKDNAAVFSYQAIGLPSGLVIDPETGVISGQLRADASTGGNATEAGEYSVTIVVTDEQGGTFESTLLIQVANLEPITTDVTATLIEDRVREAEGNVLFDDQGNVIQVDLDGDDLRISQIDSLTIPVGETVEVVGSYGVLSISSDGTWHYEQTRTSVALQSLNFGETGIDQFAFTVNDSQGGAVISQLIITIEGDAEPHVASEPVEQAPLSSDSQANVFTGDSSSGTGGFGGGSASDNNLGAAASVIESYTDKVIQNIRIEPVQLSVALRDIVVNESLYKFSLPPGAFESTNNEDISIEATLPDGSPLPDYINFDEESGTFIISRDIALAQGIEKIEVKVTGEDESGNEASTSFIIYLVNEDQANGGPSSASAELFANNSTVVGQVSEPLVAITQSSGRDTTVKVASKEMPGSVESLSIQLASAGQGAFEQEFTHSLDMLMELLQEEG